MASARWRTAAVDVGGKSPSSRRRCRPAAAMCAKAGALPIISGIRRVVREDAAFQRGDEEDVADMARSRTPPLGTSPDLGMLNVPSRPFGARTVKSRCRSPGAAAAHAFWPEPDQLAEGLHDTPTSLMTLRELEAILLAALEPAAD
jgi:hypothetical protein